MLNIESAFAFSFFFFPPTSSGCLAPSKICISDPTRAHGCMGAGRRLGRGLMPAWLLGGRDTWLCYYHPAWLLDQLYL